MDSNLFFTQSDYVIKLFLETYTHFATVKLLFFLILYPRASRPNRLLCINSGFKPLHQNLHDNGEYR